METRPAAGAAGPGAIVRSRDHERTAAADRLRRGIPERDQGSRRGAARRSRPHAAHSPLVGRHARRLRHERAGRARRPAGPAAAEAGLDSRSATSRRSSAPAPTDDLGRRCAAAARSRSSTTRGAARSRRRCRVHRPARGPERGVRPRRGGARPRDRAREHQSSRARADDHRPQLPREDQREHRQLRRAFVDRRGGGEAALGDALGRRHGDGSVDRQGHSRDARVDSAQRARAHRHGAHLSGAREGGRTSRSAHLGDLPRHAHRAGGAGRRLLHGPRRRAPALHPAHGRSRHRHRVARRLDHRQVVPRASQGELSLHAVPRHLRDHARLRRVVLAGRRAATGIDRRCQRRGAVRRARDAGRAHADRLGVRRPGDERRAGPHPHAPHSREHGEAARVVPARRRSTRSGRSRPTSRRATTTSRRRSARR